MGVEIERKFRVKGEDWKCVKPLHIIQGYLNTDKSRTVRIRVADDSAFITVKGLTAGISRSEFEYAIPADEAREMLHMCAEPAIEKYRYVLPIEDLVWEVDEFLGANEGLVVAEVELLSETQVISLPDWIGEEVSGDSRFYNSSLSAKPYTEW